MRTGINLERNAFAGKFKGENVSPMPGDRVVACSGFVSLLGLHNCLGYSLVRNSTMYVVLFWSVPF